MAAAQRPEGLNGTRTRVARRRRRAISLSAGETVVGCLRTLATNGTSVIGEVLGGRIFVEWEHYPPEDAYDPGSGAQYYYHAHPGAMRERGEHGHFHLFLRNERPATHLRLGVASTSRPDDGATSHLVAISMNPYGLPIHLFTTNRWVTGGTWHAANTMVRMLDRFAVDVARPSLVNRWMAGMIRLFRPVIVDLLVARDRTVAQWQHDHPDRDVFEDRDLEITSIAEIDVVARIREMTTSMR